MAQHISDPVQRALAERLGVRERRFHIEGDVLGEVVRSGRSRFAPTMPGNMRPIVGSEHEDPAALKAFGNFMAPLRARGQAIGLVSVTRTIPGSAPYTDEDREFLEELAARAAVAIDAARLYRAAQQATAALRVSERRLRAMFNSTRVGIVARDGDGSWWSAIAPMPRCSATSLTS